MTQAHGGVGRGSRVLSAFWLQDAAGKRRAEPNRSRFCWAGRGRAASPAPLPTAAPVAAPLCALPEPRPSPTRAGPAPPSRAFPPGGLASLAGTLRARWEDLEQRPPNPVLTLLKRLPHTPAALRVAKARCILETERSKSRRRSLGSRHRRRIAELRHKEPVSSCCRSDGDGSWGTEGVEPRGSAAKLALS